MKKAHYIINYLIANRSFRRICSLNNLPYKYIYKITKNEIIPSTNVKNALYFLICPSYWYDEADNDFICLFKSFISENKYFNISMEITDHLSENTVQIVQYVV